MRIFRIEKENGKGPYHNSNSEELDELLSNHNGCSEHPDWFSDDLVAPDDNWHCGFTSIGQMLRWFPLDHIHILRENGYFIRRIEVDCEYVRASQYQCIFDMSQADYVD